MYITCSYSWWHDLTCQKIVLFQQIPTRSRLPNGHRARTMRHVWGRPSRCQNGGHGLVFKIGPHHVFSKIVLNNPYKWPYKWVTGVNKPYKWVGAPIDGLKIINGFHLGQNTLLIRNLFKLFITGRGLSWTVRSINLRACPWKFMLGKQAFPFGEARPFLRGKLTVPFRQGNFWIWCKDDPHPTYGWLESQLYMYILRSCYLTTL